MGKMEENTASKRTDGSHVSSEASCYDDEIDLVDYFAVLWKRKIFIFLGAILPSLILGIILFVSPKNYQVTFIYNVSDDAEGWNLNETNYTVLRSRFYSEENSKILCNKMQNNVHERYVRQLHSENPLDEIVVLDVYPPFPDSARTSIKDPDQLNRLREMAASLLHVTIYGSSKEDIQKLSPIIRHNIESVIPLHSVCDQLTSSIKNRVLVINTIENSRFNLALNLKTVNETLAGLKKITPGSPNTHPEGVLLQFDIGDKNQYLPLSNQIQAAESRRIDLENTIQSNEEKYFYNKDLLEIETLFLAELNGKPDSDHTLKQYHLFLSSLVGNYEKPQLKDYLNSSIRMIENRMSAGKPTTEWPTIVAIGKNMAMKLGVVFAVGLILSIFAVFLKEGISRYNTRL